MDGLEEEYGEEIQFVWLNVDNPQSRPLREQYDIVRRTTYALIDEDGQRVQVWIGLLNELEIEFEILDWLTTRDL